MIKHPFYVYGDQDAIKVPSHLNCGKHLLAKFCTYKDSAAIINAETSETLTHKELAQQAVNIALSLVHMGVRKGQVVGICSEKRMEFIPTVVGILCAGATFTAADATGGRATILHRINLAKPTVMFCSPAAYDIHKDTLKSVESIKKIITFGDATTDNDAISFKEFLTKHAEIEEFLPIEVNGWEDLAIIFYSSGTTGLPKGIPLTHLKLLLCLGDTGEQSIYVGKNILVTREWYYTYGLVHTLILLHEGATTLYCPRGEVKDFLEAIQKYKVHTMQLAPVTIAEMAKSSILPQYDVSSLMCMISSSSPLNAELEQTIKTRIPNLQATLQCYGMTEAGCLCSDKRSPKGPKTGSVGCITDTFIFKVVDLHTRDPLGPNQRGEICFKSPSLMSGYLGDASPDYLDEEGFFKTGDIGYYDEDRYFYVIDRIKELIKFNSYQVAPAELEAVLLQHPAVLAAGVSGAPHPKYGEVPTAFVVLQAGCEVTEEELISYVDSQVSYRMRLAGGVRFVDSLPMVHSGKLNRKALKKILAECAK